MLRALTASILDAAVALRRRFHVPESFPARRSAQLLPLFKGPLINFFIPSGFHCDIIHRSERSTLIFLFLADFPLATRSKTSSKA